MATSARCNSEELSSAVRRVYSGHADAGAHLEVEVADRECAPEGTQQEPGDRLGVRNVADVRQNDGELVAAQPGHVAVDGDDLLAAAGRWISTGRACRPM